MISNWQPRAFVQRFLMALLVTSVFTASGVGGAYWLANDKLDETKRADVDLAEEERGEPANYLIIGSDTRSFVDDALDAEHFGSAEEQGGQRSDTIMIAHIDPDTETGLLVSFPRDLWVDIPGLGSSKINAAFNEGPQRVVDTIQQNFGVDIHHYVEINFDGFREIVDAIGDVPIHFPTPARDTYTGLLVEEAGCRELNGGEALAYARSRYYEYQDADGDWHEDPTADLGRIRRQQYFIRSLVGTAIKAGVRNFTKANDILNKVTDQIQLDPDLGMSDVLALVRTFREVDPAVVEMVTIPTRSDNIDGQSVEVMVDDQAAPIFERLKSFGSSSDTTLPDVAPADVKVGVRNGSGVSGQAKAAFDALEALGFAVVGPPSNADQNDYALTEVRYGPGKEAEAGTVLANLNGAGQLVKLDEAPSGADVVVVLGRDFESVATPAVAPAETDAPATAAPAPAEPTTTTTAGPPANPGGDEPMPVAGC